MRDGTGRCAAHKFVANKFSDKRRGSRHQRGYGSAWVKQRERVLARDAGLCQPCLKRGVVTPATEVDHIVNKQAGGSEEDDNLQSICAGCHKAKTAREARAGRG